jgi:hypothetical protein
MKEFRFEKRAFAVGIALLVAMSGNADAQTGQMFFQTTTFGMVGLARNQAARLNVLNPGNAYGDRNPVCSAEMSFLDDQGRELKSSAAPVDWGKAVSLELDRSSLPGNALRVQIRAVLRTAINRPDPLAASSVMPGAVCSFLPTLEIFDKDTGKTSFLLSEGRSFILNTPVRNSTRTPVK